MALPLYALKMLAPHLKGASVLCLGHPDILATAQELEALFGVTPTRFCANGGAHSVERPLVDTQELFGMLGSTLDCVDVYAFRGTERIVDLNEPQYLGEYDVVIDPGTTEHCFNIGQAMMNAANAVKPGGRIYHSPPMTMLNHGFYNICPTMLWDFYEQNGWVIERLEARNGDSCVQIDRALAWSRKANVAPETSIVCLARRRVAEALRYPTQAKYLAMQKHMEKAAA